MPASCLHERCRALGGAVVLGMASMGVALAADPSALAQRYIRAYPQFFVAYQDGQLLTKTGKRIPFDDGRSKDYERMIVDPAVGDHDFDPEDAFHWPYAAGVALPSAAEPPAGDPGRIRPAAIFQTLYGATAAERARRLRAVPWFPTRDGKLTTLRVTTVNGVDQALERVATALRGLSAQRKRELDGLVFNTDGFSGHFERPVRGFPLRTSGHAYGIAVDVNWNAEYFSGSHRNQPYRYRNQLPQFLVEIFEREGFIWGGRWHDYDSLHFEYRPELLGG
ncbi:MAG: M15 family metallopeptidase [Gammaproteobacteria bacterium]